MIDPFLRRQLGYDPDMDEAELINDWKARLGIVCKPCWELKYCPYGPLVEDFPLLPISRNDAIAHNEYMKKALAEGVFDSEKKTKDSPAMNRDEAEKEIAEFNPDDYQEDPFPPIIQEAFCRVFGHMCPVFSVAEPFTETKDGRRKTRNIDRATMLQVVRRDANRCQICGEYVEDDDIDFDHIIPYSRGGQTTVENLRLTHSSCNRKKSTKLEFLEE